MPLLDIVPNLTSQGLPEMPDISNIVDEIQTGIGDIDIPKPPGVENIGGFVLGLLGTVCAKFGLPDVFSSMLPTPPSGAPELPSLPDGTVLEVPQIPKSVSPFKLPF